MEKLKETILDMLDIPDIQAIDGWMWRVYADKGLNDLLISGPSFIDLKKPAVESLLGALKKPSNRSLIFTRTNLGTNLFVIFNAYSKFSAKPLTSVTIQISDSDVKSLIPESSITYSESNKRNKANVDKINSMIKVASEVSQTKKSLQNALYMSEPTKAPMTITSTVKYTGHIPSKPLWDHLCNDKEFTTKLAESIENYINSRYRKEKEQYKLAEVDVEKIFKALSSAGQIDLPLLNYTVVTAK